jgi:hydroxypyruvate reductase
MPAKPRCAWAGPDPLTIRYHDDEWGLPLHDDRLRFEFLVHEGAQAGLSWITNGCFLEPVDRGGGYRYENAMSVEHLKEIFQAGVRRVDPERMITDCLRLAGSTLTVKTETAHVELDLGRFARVVVTGAGKAGAKLALGLEAVLGERITEGLVAVKYGHTERLKKIRLIEAGHPVPDAMSVEAARRIAGLVSGLDEKTLVITLISGGGSALLTLPYQDIDHQLTLEDIRETTRLLLECGAPIQDINCIRKHASGISGGRFAALLGPAACLTLILSDVVGDRLESIASGLTAPDPMSFADAVAILEKFGILNRVPASVRRLMEAGAAGRVEDTPKPGDPSFKRLQNVLIGTNSHALEAARRKAAELGYRTVSLTSQMAGESREVAKVLAAIAKDVVRAELLAAKPACILVGGETTVTIRGKGKGGRNQEMALAFLQEMEENPEAFAGVSFLSAGTDGNDGPTDAAGAFASLEVLGKARKAGLSIHRHLDTNDAYSFFDSIGSLYKTGPTNTNVCDLQVIIVTAL